MTPQKPGGGLYSIALESAARGILIPILSLILLSKGLTLSTLPAGLGACSAAILIFELPGGLLSDWIGRKRMFLTAQISYLAALTLLLVSQSPAAAVASMLLYGIARAASSGSLDALTIDTALAVYGKDYLARITARISTVRTAGLALGSLAGGLLYQNGLSSASQKSNLFFALLAALVLTISAFITALFFTRELCPPASENSSHENPDPVGRKHRFIPDLAFSKALIPCFAAVSLMGIFISIIEPYWSPRFSELLGQDSLLWLLGLLGFSYFGVSILGAAATELLLKQQAPERLFPASYLLAASCLILLSLTGHPAIFFILYLLLYFFVGIGDTALTVSLNQETLPSLRATILSLQSFLFQLGGFSGLFLSGLAVKTLGIPGLWFAGAVLFLIAAGAIGIYLPLYRKRHSQK